MCGPVTRRGSISGEQKAKKVPKVKKNRETPGKSVVLATLL